MPIDISDVTENNDDIRPIELILRDDSTSSNESTSSSNPSHINANNLISDNENSISESTHSKEVQSQQPNDSFHSSSQLQYVSSIDSEEHPDQSFKNPQIKASGTNSPFGFDLNYRTLSNSLLNTSPQRSHLPDFQPHEILNKEHIIASLSPKKLFSAPLTSSAKTKDSYNLLSEFVKSSRSLDTPTPSERIQEIKINPKQIRSNFNDDPFNSSEQVSIPNTEINRPEKDHESDNCEEQSIQSLNERLQDLSVLSPSRNEQLQSPSRFSDQEMDSSDSFDENDNQSFIRNKNLENSIDTQSTIPTTKDSSTKQTELRNPTQFLSSKEDIDPFLSKTSSPCLDANQGEPKLSPLHLRPENTKKNVFKREVIGRPNLDADFTEINDTMAQLDQDSEIDMSRLLANVPSRSFTPQKHHEVNKQIKSPTSPWNKIRSVLSLTYKSTEASTRFKPNNDGNMFAFKRNSYLSTQGGSEITTSQKIDELNKEITSYKIQLKFFKEFIQNLIDKSRETNQNVASLLDISRIVNKESELSEVSEKYDKLEDDFKNLKLNYDEVYHLNEDLYESLESFENQLHSKDEQLGKLNDIIAKSSRVVDSILDTLVENKSIDETTEEELSKFVGSEIPIDVKLQKFESKLSDVLKSKTDITASSIANEEHEITEQIQVIESLMGSVELLKKQVEEQKTERAIVEKQLLEKAEESNRLRSNFKLLNEKFNNLSNTILNSGNSEVELNKTNPALHAENLQDALIASKSTRSEDYEEVIKHLNDNIQRLESKNEKLELESSGAIASLTKQLQITQQEILMWRSKEKEWDHIKTQLAKSSEHERILETERIRLSRSVDVLLDEKHSLKGTIQDLTQKIKDSNNEGEHETKKLKYIEYQLNELISYDVTVFHKLWKSFNKIAEDNSFQEPTRRLNLLKRYLNDEQDPNLPEWSERGSKYIREQHKYIFEYFARAVEILVNDHVKLLLLNEAEDIKTRDYIASLVSRISQLEEVNDSLSKQLDTSEYDSSYSPEVDVSKIKLQEISMRFKAEREQRVYENNQARRRLKELELENANLRGLLNNT